MAEAAKIKTYVSLILGFIECVMFAGVFLGWPNLVFVYKREGLFSHICNNSAISNSTNVTRVEITCTAADQYYSMTFSVSMALQSVCTFPTGVFFDRYGVLKTRILGTCMFVPACLFLGLASKDFPWLILLGFPLLGLAAKTTMVAATHLAGLMKSRMTTLITIYIGGMGTSPIVLFLFKLLYETHDVSLKYSFIALLCLWIVILIFAMIANPWFKVDSKSRDEELHNASLMNKKGSRADATFLEILRTPHFWIMTYCFSVAYTKTTFTIGSLNLWLNQIANHDIQQVSSYTNGQTYTVLSLIFLSPITGIIIDAARKAGWGSACSTYSGKSIPLVPGLLIGSSVMILHTVVTFFSSSLAVYLSLLILRTIGMINFGMMFSYMRLVFPRHAYGKLVGLSYLVGGLIALVQYPMFLWPASTGSFFEVNLFLLIFTLSTLAQSGFILGQYFLQKRRMQAKPKSMEEVALN